jgi:hypothetical protein
VDVSFTARFKLVFNFLVFLEDRSEHTDVLVDRDDGLGFLVVRANDLAEFAILGFIIKVLK